MRTWVRVPLVVLGSVLGMVLGVVVEAVFIQYLGRDPTVPYGHSEGTGLVIVMMAPFAAIVGGILGAFGVLRLSGKRSATAPRQSK